ncbi:zf-HC2 domain-containing protein [Spirulina major CS-329]|uniref:anti-sigma factor family protein n=2 Tax=Spirulinaceae TaxID=1890448 RepID=UPI00232FE3DE|nr:zf-HC2 domain-containing protein [Spirulina major]MDB9505491.1 zf-HC2 domain-containing protein [Spirulina major CS-329]
MTTNNDRPAANYRYSLPSDSSDFESPMDIHQRDRFELLSAYLDGEVSPAERQEVQTWLADDPAAQHLHRRLQKLRYGLQTLPIPAPQQSTEDLLAGVFEAEDHRRVWSRWAWGGGAIAAAAVGALSLFFSGSPLSPRLAHNDPGNLDASSSSLMIAVNQPVVEIPTFPSPSSDLSISIDRPVVDIPMP